MTLPQLLGNDHVAQTAPDRLFTGPAERVLGGRVPLADDALVVHDDDAVERGVEHGFALGRGLAGRSTALRSPSSVITAAAAPR